MIEGAGGALATPEMRQLLEALAAFRRRPLAGLSGDALAEDLAQLCRARGIFELAVAETTRAYAATDHAEAYGYNHPVGYLREAGHLATGAAVAADTVGSELRRLSLFQSAVEAGEIGFAHV